MNTLRILLRRLAVWILISVKPSEDEVSQALRSAFLDAGLSADLYTPEYDLLHSGKLHEVLVHASQKLGNPLVTVQDLKELLE